MKHLKNRKKIALPILLSLLLALCLSPGVSLAAGEGSGQEDASEAASADAGSSASSGQDGLAAVDDQGQAELAAATTLTVQDTVFDVTNNPYVEVDGNAVLATSVTGGVCVALTAPADGEEPAHFLTYYRYNNTFSNDASYDEFNAMYPTNMYVWELSYDSQTQTYTAERMSAFDDVLKYAGCAVRTSGTKGKGIRLVTSMPSDTRSTLMSSGIDGYTLVETGTLIQWDADLNGSSLTESNCLRQGRAYVSSTGTDPIYKSGNGLIKYTNVLTGFSDEQCKPLISLRPYMKLSNGTEEYTLYGGTVHRSIGYIASQNTSEFGKGTVGYRFIWDAVHAAYGDSLDSTLGYVDWDIRANVTCENQCPELPWGCESLALTNTLRGYGYSLNKTDIYDTYLSHSTWDFVHAYAGDAYNETGIGMCMPPAITDAANRFLIAQGAKERAYNITGTSFENILSYIDQGYPVITWSTSFLDSPTFVGDYIEGYRAYVLVHCIPVIGHDGYNSVTVSCSGNGCYITHDYDTFASIYAQCGKCAVVIL